MTHRLAFLLEQPIGPFRRDAISPAASVKYLRALAEDLPRIPPALRAAALFGISALRASKTKPLRTSHDSRDIGSGARTLHSLCIAWSAALTTGACTFHSFALPGQLR